MINEIVKIRWPVEEWWRSPNTAQRRHAGFLLSWLAEFAHDGGADRLRPRANSIFASFLRIGPGSEILRFSPERKLLDWPPLLAELADKMEIGEFRILGISGGAPYALAAAWAIAGAGARDRGGERRAAARRDWPIAAGCFRSIAGCSFFIRVIASCSASPFTPRGRFFR